MWQAVLVGITAEGAGVGVVGVTRRLLSAATALTLVAATTVVVQLVSVTSAQAFDAPTTQTWSGAAGTQSSAITNASGVTTTATLTGQTVVRANPSTLSDYAPTAAMFSPNLVTTTPALRLTTLVDQVGLRTGGITCPNSGTCSGLGTITLVFSQPVANPTIHIAGLGASATSGSNTSVFHAILTLASSVPAGAALGAVSSGNSNLRVNGTAITTTSDRAGTACNSTAGTGVTATSGCGSVTMTGTFTSLTFNVSTLATITQGTGSMQNSGTATLADQAGDAYVLAVTFPQDFSDAPASYNGSQAPANVIGDLKLGATIDEDNATTANATASPFAQTGAAVNTAGDNTTGSDEDAISTPWPTLTTASIGSTYGLTVPISGASKAGQVCGWIDFDRSGTFTATAPVEQACASFAAGASTAALSWTVPTQMAAGLTYARLRAAYGAVASPTDLADSGETEDYALTILPSVVVQKSIPNSAVGQFSLLVNGTAFASNVGNGGTTGSRTLGTNLGATITTPSITVTQDITSAVVPVTASETATAGNLGTFSSAYSCVNGLGTSVGSGTGTSAAFNLPQSLTGSSANGRAQSVVCTFTNTGTPALTLTKTASPTTITAAGQVVTYTFGVSNTGNVPVSALSITDTMTSPALNAGLSAVTCSATSLAPGAATTCTGTYTSTLADLNQGSIANTATAAGTATGGAAVTSNTATATVTATRTPALTLTKTASPTTITTAGQVVTYSFGVTNSGNITVTGLTIADAMTAPALNTGLSAVTCTATSLAPAASTTCTGTYTTTQADINNGTVRNTATANGTSTAGAVTSNTATATVTATQTSSLTMVKSAAPTTVTTAGQAITYTFAVTNSGNVTIASLTIVDTMTAPATNAGLSTVNCVAQSLTPGQSTTCTGTYTPTQADIDNGSINNVATARGTNPAGNTISSATSSATVTATRASSLSLTKSPSPSSVNAVGQQVTYTFVVRNTGNVTISGISIADTMTSPALNSGLSSVTCAATTLAPSAQTNCTGTYTATQADLDSGAINNVAVANATAAGGGAVSSNTASASVSTQRNPRLQVVKSANPSTVSTAGQTVTYSFAVSNTGNVTVSSVGISDTMTAPALNTGLSAVTCTATTLAPGASTSCSGTYNPTQADVDNGSINNVAAATGRDPAGGTVTSSTSNATVQVTRTSALTVTKTPSPAAVTTVGQLVTYTFVVRNTGNITVTSLAITDTMTAPALNTGLSAVTCSATTLAPAGQTTCTGTYTVTQADITNGAIRNTASASGSSATGGVTSPSVQATVTATQTPALTLVKSASPTTVTAAGQAVTYTFTVTNSGNVSITGLTIGDTMTAPALNTGLSAVTCTATTLAPAAATSCTGTYTATQADINNGSVANTATASGTNPGGTTTTSNTSTATVTATRTPALTLTKTPSPTTVTAAGQVVTYAFAVTNSGNVTVTGLTIVDTMTSPALGSGLSAVSCTSTTLIPGATTNCTGTYTATQADINNGSIGNVAVANGTGAGGSAVASNTAPATVTATRTPGLTLVKSASPAAVTAAGQSVSYAFAVTNSGNVTINSLAISDTMTAPALNSGLSAVSCSATTLVPGASTSCTGTYTATQADVNSGSINNTATASGTAPTGGVTSTSSSASVPVTRSPALTLTKTPSPTTVTAAGQAVTYTFGVTNSGNVTVSSLAITDTMTAPALNAGLSAVTCIATTLAPAASTSCTGTYTTTQADLNNGTVRNSATAGGTSAAGAVTSNTATATVTATQSPALTLVKSASPTTVTAGGQAVTYTFAVTNSGNVTLTGLTIVDTMTAPATNAGLSAVTCTATTLTPGQSTNCSGTYSATQADVDAGSIANVATARGTNPAGGTTSSATSSATVTATRSSSLNLTKAASPTTITAAGQVVTYTFNVRNTGNVTVTGVTINDTMTAPAVNSGLSAVTCSATTLAPSALTTCTGTYTATQADVNGGAIANTATATGTNPAGATVTSNSATATVTVTQTQRLTLVKSASPTTVSASGSVVTYTLAVTNSGNVTINALSIADTMTAPALGSGLSGVTCGATALAPSASTSCTGSYTVSQADVDNGSISNTATATGQGPAGGAVTSNTSSATVTATRAPALTLTKTPSPTNVTAAGQTITYSFAVRNTGNVSVTGLAIGDTMTAPALNAGLSAVTCAATTLAPTVQTSCTGTYTVTQADVNNGSINNVAVATGTGANGSAVTSNTAPASVTVTQTTGLSLVKSAAPTTVTAAGQTITYSFTVTNTGNVTIAALSVADTMTPPATNAGLTAVTCTTTTLNPAQATTCSGMYTPTQADIDNGSIVNTAAVSGTNPGGGTVTSNTSSATVNATRTGALSLTKAPSPTTVTAAGQTVTYTFGVTNSGNVSISGLAIGDTMTAPALNAGLSAVTCSATTLAPGAATTCTGTYAATQADINNGSIANVAVAGGTAAGVGTVTSNTAAATVTATRSASLTLVKSATPSAITAAGQLVSYTFAVTNTGNTTVSALAISDSMTSPATNAGLSAVTCTATTLAPGVATSCTGTYTATQADVNSGSVNNTATAGATSPTGAVTSNPSSSSVPVTRTSSLALTKTASPATVTAAGALVTYTFAVTNTGNVTLTGLVILDTLTAPASNGGLSAISCGTTSLTPAAQTTCTATYAASQADVDHGRIENSAIARGTNPTGSTVDSAAATATVTVTRSPSLSLVKSASPTTVSAAGQAVTYRFAVTNTGNVTVSALSIADTMTAPALNTGLTAITCNASTLVPAAATTCAGTYTVSQADVDNGSIANTAVANGTDPTGAPVASNTSSATVTAGRSSAIRITKTASPTTVTAAGQTVSYTFGITNTGNTTVTGLSITDTMTPPALNAGLSAVTCSATTLAPAAATSCTGTYSVSQADVNNGSIHNTAVATGTAAGSAVESNAATAAVTVTQSPSLSLIKSATPTALSAAGQTVTYTFAVTNTGNVTLTSLAITDTMTAPALNGGLSAVTCVASTLAPSASTSCTGTYTATQADVDSGSISNIATAAASSPVGGTVTSNPSSATVPATRAPGLTLTKTPSPTTVSAAGQTVAYTFGVSNTGNVTVTGLSITDTMTAPALASGLSGATCAATALAPGASTSCTATYAATLADLNNGSISNTATAGGSTAAGPVTSNTASATVTATRAPALTLTKSASPTTVTAAGQTVTYSFAVSNSGNVTVTGVAIADTLTPPAVAAGLSSVTCTATTLTPGQATTCSGTYTPTQTDIDNGSITNTATAGGQDPTGAAIISSTSTATVAATRSPALTLTKSPSPTTVSAAGDTVVYTFGVTNSGNISVTGLTIDDAMTAPAVNAGLSAVTCAATTLAPAAATTCTASYTVSQADVDHGSVDNLAVARGTGAGGTLVASNSAGATVSVTQSANLALVKSATPSAITAAGQLVTYTFAVTNTGNTTVTGLVITDTMAAPATNAGLSAVTCADTTLAPAATTSCTSSYSTTQADVNSGSINNTATAGAASPTGAVTSNPSSTSVPVTRSGSLSIAKAASPGTVTAAGALVTFTFTVTNTGNVSIAGISVVDTLTAPASNGAMSAISCLDSTLAPAAQTTCTGTYPASQADVDHGRIDNSAVARGTDPSGATIESVPATAAVTAAAAPSLSLVKSASPTTVTSDGQLVSYTFAVSNTGNVTVSLLSISDTMAAPATDAALSTITCAVTTLAPGVATTCTGSYTVSLADVDNGSISNTATANGTDPTGAPVVSNPSSATVTATRAPALTLTKVPSPSTVTAAGQVVTYTFAVSNSGNTTVSGLSIADTMAPPALDTALSTVTCAADTLVPNAQTTCTGTYTVSQDDVDHGRIDNSAVASGVSNGTPVSSNTASATVAATQTSALRLTKSASPTSVNSAGQTVVYTFAVSNSGNVTVSSLSITDNMAAPAANSSLSAVTCAATTLAPGQQTSCSGSYLVGQPDIDNGSINNVARAAGINPAGGAVESNESPATVNAARSTGLELTKTPSPATITAAGDVITYTFDVHNTGNVTLSGLTIADTMTAPAFDSGLSAVTCAATTLAPGAATSCTGTYTATQVDVDYGAIANVAVATTTDPVGTPVSSNNSPAVVGVTQTTDLQLVKSASAAPLTAVGQTVSYSFAVTNAGNVTIADLSITDTLAAPASPAGLSTVTCAVSSLAPGEQTSCTGTYTVSQADLDSGSVNNTATASGTGPAGDSVVSNPSSATVPTTRSGALTLTKTADPTTVTAAGDTVTYTFVATNTGNVTLTDLRIADTLTPPATNAALSAVACDTTTLLPAASSTCTASYTASQLDIDNGAIDNVAVASGTSPDGTQVVSPEAPASVAVVQSPELTLVKSADRGVVSVAGDGVVFSFVVVNSGNVTVSGLVVVDGLVLPALDADLSVVTCDVSVLAPAGVALCWASYRVSQADVDFGSVSNSATVVGVDPSGGVVVSNVSSAVVGVVESGSLSLVKSASPSTVTVAGDVVSYSFVVTNTGNVSVSGLSVVDRMVAPALDADLSVIVCDVSVLAPAGVAVCSGSYRVSQADVDSGGVGNVAVVSGVLPSGVVVVSGESSAVVGVVQDPGLVLSKVASPVVVGGAGEVVSYSFVVTNTGNVSVSGLSVVDSVLVPGDPGGFTGPVVCDVVVLGPGSSALCSVGFVVSQVDVDFGSVVNSAVVSGFDPLGGVVVSAPVSATVGVVQSPALSVVKSASPTTVGAAGQVISYAFAVTNTGNVTVSIISVFDSPIAPADSSGLSGPITCDVTTLAPGAVASCAVDYTVSQADIDNGSVGNIASARGSDPHGNPVNSPDSTATVPVVQEPALSLVKSALQLPPAAVGDIVTYTFVVTNTGNVTVAGVAIDDTPTAPASRDNFVGPIVCDVTTLVPAGIATCTGEYTVSQADLDNGVIDNVATAVGTDPAGQTVTSDESSATVPVTQAPALQLTKVGVPEAVDAVGQVVTYTFSVTNTGNVTVSGIAVTDTPVAPASAANFVGDIDCDVTTLAPTAVATCTVDYQVSQDDLDNTVIENSAVAAGTDPAGAPVVSNVAEATIGTAPAPALTVVKAASPLVVSGVGETVAYTFLVTNTGNVTITDVAIDDTLAPPAGPALAISCPVTVLAPAATTTCIADYVVTQPDLDNGTIDNSAAATGLVFGETPVRSAPSDVTIDVGAQPLLTLQKAGVVDDLSGDGLPGLGDAVRWSFIVTNLGNVTLSAITVTDDPAGPVTCDATLLAPGTSTDCVADSPHQVTQADLDAGVVTNTATATGTPPCECPPISTTPVTATVPLNQIDELGLVKVATAVDVNDDGIITVGDRVDWVLTATNLGNTTITDLAIIDPTAGAASCPTSVLPPGQSVACTVPSHVISTADVANGQVANSATAFANGEVGGVVSIEVEAAVQVEELAHTGVSVDQLALAGLGLLVLGFGLTLVGLRRPKRQAS